ncbi:CheR family methyltransferase [Lysobacter tyrosinilyticus]
MEADGFKQWLKDTMGLDAATLGPNVVDRAIEARMTFCSCRNLVEYWQQLRASPVEQQELIEAVVVPETSFFRDAEVFEALIRTYDLNWLASRPGRRLHLLSLPCSTGEEPYTMAMALLDAGFPTEHLTIDAVDISERALAKARRAVYGGHSFRGRDLQYRDRHFHKVHGGWQLSDAIRSRVGFRRGNVLDTGLLAAESYDAIFCRNLLIYFDQDTQVRVVNALARLLRPDGLLFVGPAESGLMLSLNYVSAQMPMAFAFLKPRSDAPAALSPVGAKPRATSHSKVKQEIPKPIKPKPLPPQQAKAAVTSPTSTPAPASEQALLEIARQKADVGSFDEAAVACEAHLKTHGPTSQALYLMGLIHGATGRRNRAEDYFRKALYLEPDHEEALMHLALLLETKGDTAGGRVLRMRAQRRRSKAV